MDRRSASEVMSYGATKILTKLFSQGKFHGLIALGGSIGTTMACNIMKNFPIGFPKVVVSTIASGDVRPYIGGKDIILIHSVGDISLNRITRKIFANAAAAIASMVKVKQAKRKIKPLVSTTMFGVTQPTVLRLKKYAESLGFEVIVFHAVGSGGMAIEDLIRQGEIVSVADITTHELADYLFGGIYSAGPDRLEAAGEKGIPQVVVPRALDMINFGPPETVPEKYRNRLFYRHSPKITLMRVNVEESIKIGKTMAYKLNKAKGPVTIVFPLKGLSGYDKERGVLATSYNGEPIKEWYDPEADHALLKTLKEEVKSKIEIVEVDAHINDSSFSEAVFNNFQKL